MTTPSSLISTLFWGCLLLLLLHAADAFVLVRTTTTSSSTSIPRTRLPLLLLQQQQHADKDEPVDPPPPPPTAAQQEQLDKYGPTPETSMEILLDQLLVMKDNGGADKFLDRTDEQARAHWEIFLTNMKQVKQQRAGALPGDEDEEEEEDDADVDGAEN